MEKEEGKSVFSTHRMCVLRWLKCQQKGKKEENENVLCVCRRILYYGIATPSRWYLLSICLPFHSKTSSIILRCQPLFFIPLLHLHLLRFSSFHKTIFSDFFLHLPSTESIVENLTNKFVNLMLYNVQELNICENEAKKEPAERKRTRWNDRIEWRHLNC